MTTVSSHILNTSIGKPANQIKVTLDVFNFDRWEPVGERLSASDGRIAEFTLAHATATHYRLNFGVGAYFEGLGHHGFFPEISLNFIVDLAQPHYHVPLLISPHGYTTYRGS